MRLAASNLSLGSQNATQSVGGRDIGGGGGVKKFSDGHHLPTIWHKGSKGIILEMCWVKLNPNISTVCWYDYLIIVFVGSFLAVDVANVGGGNAAILEAHSNQTSKETISMNQNSQSNNHILGSNKTNNHQISINHNHTNINLSLGHKSPSFLMKSSLLPFLNQGLR